MLSLSVCTGALAATAGVGCPCWLSALAFRPPRCLGKGACCHGFSGAMAALHWSHYCLIVNSGDPLVVVESTVGQGHWKWQGAGLPSHVR